jgi:UDP-N-acetyl-D-galactosamine dehydrogenase
MPRRSTTLVLAVPHKDYLKLSAKRLFAMLRPGGALLDIKAVLQPDDAPSDRVYWCL